jgi:uncharacterized protein (TIGR03086 family)
MTDVPDFEPAARALRQVALAVADVRLTDPTPCERWAVGDLLDHIMGLTVAFRATAEKAPAPAGRGDPSRANLDPDWRSRLPAQLDELIAAWRKPGAWTGQAAAGGVELPAQIMGVFALNELVVHGWDLARATGQPYQPDRPTLEVVHGLVEQQASAEGTPGLFGPSIPVPADASLLDRVIGLTGRDPRWPAAAGTPVTPAGPAERTR